MFLELLIFAVTSLVAYYFYTFKKNHHHFDATGVKYLPGVPVFGNALGSIFKRRHVLEDINDVYKAFPNEKYVGYVEGTNPILLIKDPELLKLITVKHFDQFVNHKKFFDEDSDELFGHSLFMMEDERWRDMRMTLSPAFTGSKLRHMLPFMLEISDNLVNYLKDHQNEEVNVDDLIRRYTNDVIASAGFGFRVNSFKDRENEFFVTGQSLFQFSWWQRVTFFFVLTFPAMAKFFRISVFPKKTTAFFRELVRTTMEYRRKNNVERADMIQILMEVSKGTLKHTETVENDTVGFATVNEEMKPHGANTDWTENEIIGQAFIFFAAGFESSASVLVMCIHELALNPDIQETLYQEIKEFEEAKGSLTYDNIAELKYLDGAINETMRKWTPNVVTDRVCNKEFILPPPHEGGDPYKIKPGESIYNPINSIHMDPKHYPNPKKFDPTRYFDENKHNIKPFTYMPFGAGPRNCIGSRFALLELKVLLYTLVLNYKIVRIPRTADPIVLLPDDFGIKSSTGTWVSFETRK